MNKKLIILLASVTLGCCHGEQRLTISEIADYEVYGAIVDQLHSKSNLPVVLEDSIRFLGVCEQSNRFHFAHVPALDSLYEVGYLDEMIYYLVKNECEFHDEIRYDNKRAWPLKNELLSDSEAVYLMSSNQFDRVRRSVLRAAPLDELAENQPIKNNIQALSRTKEMYILGPVIFGEKRKYATVRVYRQSFHNPYEPWIEMVFLMKYDDENWIVLKDIKVF